VEEAIGNGFLRIGEGIEGLFARKVAKGWIATFVREMEALLREGMLAASG
jgi:hypothetical protein